MIYDLPPMPEKAQIDKHTPTGIVVRGYTAEQMQAYARAAIEKDRERQSVPAGSLSLDAALGYIERHTPHLVYSEIKAALAAAPQPQPVQQEPVAAQQRFRHPQKTMPDWSPWQPCKVADRPAWQIDSQGYEVEYRELYTSPQSQPQPVQLLTGLILPKHRCPLTGAGIPDQTTFGEKQ